MAVPVNLSAALKAKYASGFDYSDSRGADSLAASQARFSAPLAPQGPSAGMLHSAQFKDTPATAPMPSSMGMSGLGY